MGRYRYDQLTGSPAAIEFFRLAEEGRGLLRARGEHVSVLLFDLGGMMLFNSLYGYDEGDRLLIAVSRLLTRYFSEENVCRLGQDHFAAYTGKLDADSVLDGIFSECEEMNGGRTLPIHVGVYRDISDSIDIPTACDRAKMACDTLKGAYVSGYRFFDEALLEKVEDRRYILNNFDRALNEKWIRAYYQPIVRSANGCICDEEALSRWIDPERGCISPARFIPILEETRLIYRLDLYMVDQVLEDMKKKAEMGLHLVPVSVNISRADFESCDIVEEVRRRVDAAGVCRGLMNIEITESAVCQDPAYMKAQIDRFRELGYRVWMDDFGSGYSSLDLLQTFDFDLIKFDMTFLRQFHSSPKSRIILSQLMKMALMLGVDTVVEGVEIEEHVRFLKSIGCDKLQGMYFHRPIPLDDILSRHGAPDKLEFEDPDQSSYYCAVGTANLSDPAFIDNKVNASIRPFLHAVPMAILELNGTDVRLLRCNAAYGDFLKGRRQIELPERDICDIALADRLSDAFIDAIRRCRSEENWLNILEPADGGRTLHYMIRRIAVNPVTDSVAVVAAALGFF